jgi:hypothetical protein
MIKNINLSKSEKEQLNYGVAQYPWVKNRIESLINAPTLHKVKMLVHFVEGTFKTQLLGIIERIVDEERIVNIAA